MARSVPKVPAPSDPAVDASGRLSTLLWNFLDLLTRVLTERLPVTGTATFAAGTSVAVTFAVAEPNTTYSVHIEAVANRTYWVTSKATTGFTINASASNSDTVGWTLIRR